MVETGATALESMSVTPSSSVPPEPELHEFDIETLKEGYETKRTTLPITPDDRPSVSLWAILKNSIGKDLTKISLPVSLKPSACFRGWPKICSSQNVVSPILLFFSITPHMSCGKFEQMPLFDLLVDTAAEQPDSLIRLAYVAGFAMSNYSSTVGRLAKCVLP